MNITNIYERFVTYFGEERVDLQSYADTDIQFPHYRSESWLSSDYIIIVHWPKVTVTNEFDASIDIWDLYAFTVISEEGQLKARPFFIRETYDRVQWYSDYLHSHVSSIGKHELPTVHDSCLGSGPIVNTIEGLENNTYEDLDIWSLYCWELDKYVTVESLSGVPYKRLSDVGSTPSSGSGYSYFRVVPSVLHLNKQSYRLTRELVAYLIRNNVLKYAYFDGSYHLASSFSDTVIDISNSFITMYNNSLPLRDYISIETLYKCDFLQKVKFVSGIFYLPDNAYYMPIEAAKGTKLFTFKQKEVAIRIVNEDGTYTNNELIIINRSIIDYIVYLILKYVNFEYGRETDAINKKCKVV